MIFLNSAISAAALVFDLPLCTHTDPEGKLRESGICFKIFEKTQYLMNILYYQVVILLFCYFHLSRAVVHIMRSLINSDCRENADMWSAWEGCGWDWVLDAYRSFVRYNMHRVGKKMVDADHISRRPNHPPATQSEQLETRDFDLTFPHPLDQ